jgi:glycosyltransferase involved in cell wall biosynthesis
MARGLPAVMFPCGGPSVYARHGENAEIISAETVEAVIEAIERILNNPEYYKALSECALLTSHEFSFERGLEKLVPRLSQIWQRSANVSNKIATAIDDGPMQ